MKIEQAEITKFQKVAEQANIINILEIDANALVANKNHPDLSVKVAQDWAKRRGKDGHISIGEDMDARMTAIKTNLTTKDIYSAVLGVIGLLETRVDQVRSEHSIFISDQVLQEIAESMGINQLSDESVVKQLYCEYIDLLYNQPTDTTSSNPVRR